MLRITQSGPVLQLEGRLAGPWVGELERLVNESANGVALDLARVSYVDAAGHALLRSVIAKGTEIRAASRFVAELLRGDLP